MRRTRARIHSDEARVTTLGAIGVWPAAALCCNALRLFAMQGNAEVLDRVRIQAGNILGTDDLDLGDEFDAIHVGE